MVDLITYRSTVGTFVSCHASYSQGSTKGSNANLSNGFSLTFLLTIGLQVLCSRGDPSIESNPGPGSTQEDKAVKLLKLIYSDIATVSSHRFYLKFCHEINIVPKGFKNKLSLATFKPSNEVIQKLYNVKHKAEMDMVGLHIDHYENVLQHLKNEQVKELMKLSSICDKKNYKEHIDTLESTFQSEIYRLQQLKEKKLDRLLSINSDTLKSENSWIPELKLTNTENNFIQQGEDLSDTIIDATLKLINKEEPHLELQSSVFNHEHLQYSPFETIHIHHNNSGHFVTSTSIGGKIILYDSLNLKPTNELLKQIAKLYSPDESVIPSFHQADIPFPQQGCTDCGLYAIAYVTEIIFGQNPASAVYDQSKMRSHLMSCLESRQILPFPKALCLTSPIKYTNATKDIPSTDKWEIPSKLCSPCQPIQQSSTPTSNRFHVLSENDSVATKAAATKNATKPNTKPAKVPIDPHNVEQDAVTNKQQSSNTPKPIPTDSSIDQLHHSQTTPNITQTTSIHQITDSPQPSIPQPFKLQPTTQKSHTNSSQTRPTQQISDKSQASTPTKGKHNIKKPQPIKPGSIIYNISDRVLTEIEKSVLECGLSYSPSQKEYNKENLAYDLYQFIRKLKLCEYFSQQPDDSQSNSQHLAPTQNGEDRTDMKWKEKHPDWYPDYVRNNRSIGLTKWIESITNDFNDNLKLNDSKFWNNMTKEKRNALETLANDKSITIKPADKGGAIVIMNTSDYKEACMQQLRNENHYEELPSDPTESYRDLVNDSIVELYPYITKFEKKMLKKGSRTPNFYGLPKIHKDPQDLPTCQGHTSFPPLRPICSGSDGPTVRLSEFVDSFLKPAAQKSDSYIEDSTDFINKTKNLKFPEDKPDPFLVTMDVESLYPNIDQEEGAAACEHYLNLRKVITIPTLLLKKLISVILKCNTMLFNSKFYHQIKGTAMGTAMAVNFANLFMSKTETEMLNAYEQKYDKRPTIWLRFIDDIFFIWYHDQKSLNHFIDFCNQYSRSRNMSSNIRYTSHYSKQSVVFLDMKVSISQKQIITEVYSKPTATHTYLHASSFHPVSTIRSLPKTQFIRLRRLCSTKSLYLAHARTFIQFFFNRGYKLQALNAMAVEVGNLERETLLTKNKLKRKENDNPKQVMLVTTWHPKLQFIQKTLRTSYEKFTKLHPDLKNTFPSRPLTAFKRNKTFKEYLTRSRYTDNITTSPSALEQPNGQERIRIHKNMSTETSITNNKSGCTRNISGGTCRDRNIVYAARCKPCDLIYVGQTKIPLHKRFNIHRSDITMNPKRCELPKHFNESKTCIFDRDLEIYVLQKNVTGSRNFREQHEDKWILRLDTLQPNGMNVELNSYGRIHQKLFS